MIPPALGGLTQIYPNGKQILLLKPFEPFCPTNGLIEPLERLEPFEPLERLELMEPLEPLERFERLEPLSIPS